VGTFILRSDKQWRWESLLLFMSGVLHSNILVEMKFIMQAIVKTLFDFVDLITVSNVVVMSE
jgi:hypothetical protein